MSLYNQIYLKVAEIPSGTVASYGQVAKAAGLFRGAQVVGWALRQLPADTEIPWQRVVAKDGRITIVNPKLSKTEQIERLQEEGIEIEQREGWYRVKGESFWFSFPEESV